MYYEQDYIYCNWCTVTVVVCCYRLDVLISMSLCHDEATQEYAVEALSELITIQSIQVVHLSRYYLFQVEIICIKVEVIYI